MTEREEEVFERKENKKDKGYVAFRSDDDSVGEEEGEDLRPKGKKVKREKSRTLTIRIKPKKQKKEKEKEKDKEKEKEKDKKKKKKSETLSPPQQPRKAVFGVPLEVATKQTRLPDGVELPRVFREGISHIDENCLEVEGIYRISGTKSKIDLLKENYDQGKTVNLNEFEAEVVASLVKLYLRELPENILTAALLPKFNELGGLDFGAGKKIVNLHRLCTADDKENFSVQDKSEQLEKTKKLLTELPACNRTLLAWLFTHMSHVMEKYSSNRMNLQNIGIVLSPTMNIGPAVLFLFLNYVNELFPGTKITKFNGPLTQSVSLGNDEEDLPSSPDAIASALAKQEAILSQLHEDLNFYTDSSQNDEMLWEVQRKVTQLKRKLRHSRKHTPQSKQENEPKRNDSPVAKHETDEYITVLEATEAELLLEQEELSSIGNELRKRIETEKREIERLNDEIAGLIASKEADQDLDHSGSDSDSSESKVEDSSELEKILQKLLEENKELQVKNTELCHSIHNERETCLELQVQIQMIERKKSRPTRQKMPERTKEITTEVSSKGPMIMSVTSV